MQKLMMHGLMAVVIAMVTSGAAFAADEDQCSLETLHGTYVFAATGFAIAGGAAVPKAIVEVIDFNGDGSLTTPALTLSVNGTITQLSPGSSGTYTLGEGCTGKIAFFSGTAFDIVTSPKGKEVRMIQTNPGQVFQGTATRILSDRDDRD